jgi:hypothetical protein
MSDTLGHTAAHVHTKHQDFRGRSASVRECSPRAHSQARRHMHELNSLGMDWVYLWHGRQIRVGLQQAPEVAFVYSTLILKVVRQGIALLASGYPRLSRYG